MKNTLRGVAVGFQADCPTCGAPIEFSLETSVVTVCQSCGTASGRKGDALENYGKVADLVDTRSPLQIDVVGETGGIPFKITGRTQLRHSAGGVWDEWYVAFRDGKQWGWLAEARGRYYLTFKKKLSDNQNIPDLTQLQVEDEVMVPKKGVMKVVEIGEATAISAEGEIPYAMHPGETYWYADLEGPNGKFATLDGTTNPPTLYVGGEFPLKKLGITEDSPDREEEVVTAEAAQLSCPQCGGTLDLVAPDEAERVGCPFCGSLLDVNQGNLTFLHTLKIKRKPDIPLGSKGTFEGVEYTVIGYMERFVTVEGRDYIWSEYLLHAPRQPFHWLVENQRHWSFCKPVSAGSVRTSYRTAAHAGRNFRVFDRGRPRVRTVLGEFFWKVEVGEQTRSVDYISPPYILSREETVVEEGVVEAVEVLPDVDTEAHAKKKPPARKSAREVNYTLGKYVPVEEIEQIFGVKDLKRPSAVAANQPYENKGIYWVWLAMLAAALVVGLFVNVTAARKQLFQQSFALTNTSELQKVEFIEQPITLRGGENLAIEMSNNLANRWGYLQLDLVDKNQQKHVITVPVQYGETKETKYVSALPAGDYQMRMAFKWQDMKTETQNVKVTIREGVPRLKYWIYLAVLLSVLPIGVAVHHFMFESSRWQESGVV